MDTSAVKKSDPFPIRLFLVYVFFYAGQAIYNVYLNLFLNSKGFTNTKLGLVSSISTAALVLIQPYWGILSDKSKGKNRIVGSLLMVCAAVGLCFYLSSAKIWLVFCVLCFNVFFNPAVTLQDNYTLEYLENRRWDFGQLRLGGTIGYASCAALIGFAVGTDYDQIFWMVAIFLTFTAINYFTLPKIAGHRAKKQKVRYSVLLKDRRLICMFLFNVIYSLGTAFFFQFFAIYYKNELGATSVMVGWLSTFGALAEIPFFWFAGRLQKKFGTKALMIFAGTAAACRWILLASLTDHYAILVANMLSGCGFVGFSYSMVRYINDNVPKEMRATAQSFNGILGTFVSKIIFTPISGLLADHFGVQPVLYMNGFLMVAAVISFVILFKKAEDYHRIHPVWEKDM